MVLAGQTHVGVVSIFTGKCSPFPEKEVRGLTSRGIYALLLDRGGYIYI